MERENPFHKFSRKEERRRINEIRDSEKYEERLVAYVLGTFKLSKRDERHLRDLNEAVSGQRSLTFSAFCGEHRSFPVLLGADRLKGVALHADNKATLPALFKGFDRTPFVRAYETFYDETAGRADGRSVGLVFPWKGVRHGLIIHDGDGLADAVFRGMVMTYRRSGKTLYVQPFQSLVEGLWSKGHGWRPE